MRSPEITFDIALPTLTQDVERKVKSIISTDDMMNRQIIYLLPPRATILSPALGSITSVILAAGVTLHLISIENNEGRSDSGFGNDFLNCSSGSTVPLISSNSVLRLSENVRNLDLKGSVLADSICMKVDYTNVYYHGSDSVYIRPGYIDIPAFKLYDKYGNSAMLKGFVKHRYFHEPEFEFRLSGARDLLCFDTNNKINPDWYGKIYASGGGTLRGRPGVVSMMLDVSTTANSDFKHRSLKVYIFECSEKLHPSGCLTAHI